MSIADQLKVSQKVIDSINTKIEGLSGCNEALISMKKVDTEIKTAISENVLKMAKLIAEQAVQIVPIDTGALCDSIVYYKVDDFSAEITAGYAGEWNKNKTGPVSEVGYAAFVEFGTRKMDPQPYMRPAVDMVVKEYGFSGYLQLSVNKALK
jgi:HK97 gp10 family phage protein